MSSVRCVSSALSRRAIAAALPQRFVTPSMRRVVATSPRLCFTAAAAAPLRWCSNHSGNGSNNKDSDASASSSNSLSAPVFGSGDPQQQQQQQQQPLTGEEGVRVTVEGMDGTYTAAEAAAILDLRARLAGLSEEDQQLIISALLHPEQQKPSVMGGPGIGPKDADMVAAFTCGKCDFRMVKKFSKHAYTRGIVIIECPNCRAKHLIADNLGWIEDEATNIEDMLQEKGERFVRLGSGGDYQVVATDEEESAAAQQRGAGGKE